MGSRSLLGICLLGGMSRLELGKGVQVGHNALNVGELSHVDAKTFGIEDLSRQESIS